MWQSAPPRRETNNALKREPLELELDDTYIQYHITAGYSHRGITHIKHIAVYTNKNYDISSPSTIGEGGVERRAV